MMRPSAWTAGVSMPSDVRPRVPDAFPAAEHWTYAESFVYALARYVGFNSPWWYAEAYRLGNRATAFAAREPRRRAELAAYLRGIDDAYGRGSPLAAAARACLGDARPMLFFKLGAES